MTHSLKKKAGFALVWSLIDKGGQQLIQLIFGCILARLLSPQEFGLIAILTIFSRVANILQESGFSSALIRKKEVKEGEYSSVFYFNISISVIIYIIFFFCAPYIGNYYHNPILTNLARFIFLSFIFDSFGIVQNINLTRGMNFKINARISLISGVISGIVSITMALMGYGVWSLAAQITIQSFLRNLFLWIFVKWTPKGGFRFHYIKQMLGFSSKLLGTALMNQIFTNIYSIIIGKFSLFQNGLFSQAKKLTNIPQTIISDGIKNVTYPLIASIHDDRQREKAIFRKIIRMTSFIAFPVALICIVMAKPIIIILLSKKWIDATILMQILGVGSAIFPLYCLLCTLLQKEGKSGRFFILELIRNTLTIISILIGLQYQVLGLVIGIACVNLLAFIIGIIISENVISYKITEFISDIFPYAAISLVSFIPMIVFNQIQNIYLQLLLQLCIGCILYIAITRVLGSVILKDIYELIKNQVLNKKPIE